MAQGFQGEEGAGFGMMRGEGVNGTCTRALGAEGMPRFNETAHEEFEAAVESGDFAAATKLHDEYGFGGPMFEKLNATTFAKFSQVHKLQSELMAGLGMEKGQGMMQGEGAGRMRGMGGGRGMHRQTD